MASLGTSSVTQTSARLYVDGLNTTSQYTDIYITCNGRQSSNLARPQGSSSSYYFDVTGLSPGTYYTASYTLRTSAGSTGNGSGGFWTQSAPVIQVGSMGRIYMSTSSVTPGQISFNWDAVTNATSYVVRLHRGIGPYNLIRTDTITSTNYSYSGLDENTAYTIEAYGIRSGSPDGASNWAYTYTYSFDVGPLPSLTIEGDPTVKGRMNIWWNNATNATSYGVEIYRGATTQPAYLVDDKIITSGNSTFFTGLLENSGYTVKVFGKRQGYPNGDPLTKYASTADLTPPTITNISGDGNGRAYFSWSASDTGGVGLRDINRYYTTISNANGTTYGNGLYSNDTYRTFTTDGLGNDLVPNAWYYMRVVAYDNNNNNSTATAYVQYKLARPIEWQWHTAKTPGQPVRVTADEWNSFCTKINQFRLFKSLPTYSFTTAISGYNVTATQMNQARAAILGMTSAVPSAVSPGQNANASFLNGLSTALNSIY